MEPKKKKKGLLVLGIALLIVVPLLIASLILMENYHPDPSRGTVSGITLQYQEQTLQVEEKEEIQFFLQAAKSGASIEKSAKELSEYRKLEVTFHKLNRDITYLFYLSDSENDCVYTDVSGSLFLFPKEMARRLQGHKLLGDYALSFAEYPEVSVSGVEESFSSSKTEGQWHYVNADGEKVVQKVSQSKESRAILPQGEKLNLAFSMVPDYCSVLLTGGEGEVLYSGVYEEMQMFHLDRDTKLALSVSCDWYENEKTDYHGSLTYTFDLFYDVPTLCTVDQNQAQPGEVFTVTVAHSSSPTPAVMASFPHGEIVLTEENGVFVAKIPVLDTAAPGEFSITVMGSDVDATLDVSILPAQ